MEECHHGHRQEINGESLLDDIEADLKFGGNGGKRRQVGIDRESSQHRKARQDNNEE